MWFHGVHILGGKAVKECLACQSVGQPAKPAPLVTMPIPTHACDTVYADFLGPLPINDLLLVMIDGRTCFPEVHGVQSTNAKSTIQCFESVFATHRVPRTVASDNGPSFQSNEI